MSGASSNAAARRRRGVSQANNTYTTQSVNSTSNKSQSSQNNLNVPTLTVSQILMQLDQRISKIEYRFNTPSEAMLDIHGNVDVTLFPQKFGDLENKLLEFEENMKSLEKNITDNVVGRLNTFASSISALETKIEGVNSGSNNVSKEEFNNIMNNVGDDVGILTEQVGDLKDLVLTVQNSTILLDKSIIELNNEFRTTLNPGKLETIEEESKEESKEENTEQSETNKSELEEETQQEMEQEMEQELNKDIIDNEDNVQLQVKEIISQEKIKEEVSEVVNDELIKKLKLLNSVEAEEKEEKENENKEDSN